MWVVSKDIDLGKGRRSLRLADCWSLLQTRILEGRSLNAAAQFARVSSEVRRFQPIARFIARRVFRCFHRQAMLLGLDREPGIDIWSKKFKDRIGEMGADYREIVRI